MDQIARHLRGIINHWNEFGPEHGLDELMTHATNYLASHHCNAHKTMTPEEYAAMPIVGWHLVCRNYDGFGGTGVRFITDGVIDDPPMNPHAKPQVG